MNYQKLTEIASAGPLEVHEDENGWCEVVRKERTVVAGIKFRDTVATLPYYRSPETLAKGKADAAKLAHCYNHFDAVLEAQQSALDLLHQALECMTCGDDAVLINNAKGILQDAKAEAEEVKSI